jgi:DNA-binding beta-propeller fold protein YncE
LPVKNWKIGLFLLAMMAWTGLSGCRKRAPDPSSDADWLQKNPTAAVNPFAAGGALLPTQQLLTPAGTQVELPGMRPQVLALSPDGSILATCGITHELVLVDPATGKVLQHVPLFSKMPGATTPPSANDLKPDPKADSSFTGLTFSPDGSRIYLSNGLGNIQVFGVDKNQFAWPVNVFPLPDTQLQYHRVDVPAGLKTSADGKRLYVVLNASNRLLEMDAQTGQWLRQWPVGDAPYDVAIVGQKAYVSNWGGRRVDASGPKGPIGEGATVRVDPVRFIANEGSVSVLDIQSAKTIKEILTGMHACALARSPDSKFVAVANANSDTISIIDCSTDTVVQTICSRWDSKDFFGASPNALAFDATGSTLYACNGTQNAVAVIDFSPDVSKGGSTLRGLIPTGWFPGAIVSDPPRKAIYVANIKGLGSGKRLPPDEPPKFNSLQFYGTLSLIPNPSSAQLQIMTETVLENDRRRAALASLLPPRPNVLPKPVPDRVGEPSVFKHVIYIIKENRTYDQVLGDMSEGNGGASLCIYGQKVTPNEHKISRQFVLLDNTYCSGAISADGHQWADTAFCTDYVERSFAANFPRSYPFGGTEGGFDALAYSSSGFIWDNVTAHGKSLRDYGEFTLSTSGWASDTHPDWNPGYLDYLNDYVRGTHKTRIGSRAGIPSLAKYLDTQTVGWALEVPDVIRAQKFIADLHAFEKSGTFPDMCILWLPNDHTSATRFGAPTPEAQVADNDLAVGQVVDAVSHSAFWKDTCIFAIEDDTQDGWDHVNAFRTTAYVISPYTKRSAVVDTNYAQPGLMHTMELILGLPPMNQFDAQATPMSDCFMDTPDFTPYDAEQANVYLNEMNPAPVAIRDPLTRQYALASADLPLSQPDQCPEDLLNHILWNAARGSWVPFPDGIGQSGNHTDSDDDDDDDH